MLGTKEIEANFDLDYHLKHVDTIFARVFGRAWRRQHSLTDGARMTVISA